MLHKQTELFLRALLFLIGQMLQPFKQRLGIPLDDAVQDILFIFKMVIQKPAGYVYLVNDILRCGIQVSFPCKQPDGGIHDLGFTDLWFLYITHGNVPPWRSF